MTVEWCSIGWEWREARCSSGSVYGEWPSCWFCPCEWSGSCWPQWTRLPCPQWSPSGTGAARPSPSQGTAGWPARHHSLWTGRTRTTHVTSCLQSLGDSAGIYMTSHTGSKWVLKTVTLLYSPSNVPFCSSHSCPPTLHSSSTFHLTSRNLALIHAGCTHSQMLLSYLKTTAILRQPR